MVKWTVKKSDPDRTVINTEINSNKDLDSDKIKTTNVNILLNRVRLDKKRSLKKKIVFLLFLSAIISSLAVYLII